MKREIFILICILIIFIFGIKCVDIIYHKTKEFKKKEKHLRKLENIPPNVKILNVGSGPSVNGFDWDAFSFGENIAWVTETFYYDKKILERYCTGLDDETIILHVICPLSFAKNIHLKKASYSKIFVPFLSCDDVLIKHGLYFLERRNPLFSRPIRVLISVARKVLHLEYEENNEFRSEEDSKNGTDQILKGWIHDNPGIDNFEDATQSIEFKNAFNENIEQLSQIYEFCEKHNYKYYAVILPESEYLSSHFSEAFMREFLYKNISKAGIPEDAILDYRLDKKFRLNRNFTNGLFLTLDARKEFTAMVTKMIGVTMENTEETKTFFETYDGQNVPTIGLGTGVVRKYSRNLFLYTKEFVVHVLYSIYTRRKTKQLIINKNEDKIVKRANEIGFQMFDSARIYGYSEKMIGDAFQNTEREKLFLTTKISDMDIERKASPNDVIGNFENSLSFLRTDYVDAYLLHWPHGDWISIYKQMEKLYYEGRAKALGVCNCTIADLEKLQEDCRVKPMFLQCELHPFNSKKVLRQYCKEHGILIMAHTPTGRMCEKVTKSEVLQKIANNHNKTIAQVILRWHFQNQIIPIVATVSESHMKENLNIKDFSLSDVEMNQIEELDEDYVLLPGNGIDDQNYIYNL